MSRNAYRFAVVWTVGVTGFLLFGPSYAGSSSAIGADGSVVESSRGATLIEVNGPRVLFWLAIPLLLVAVPMLVKKAYRRRVGVACALLMFVLALVGSLSIGVFYYPTAIALLLAATNTKGEAITPPQHSSG